MINEASDKLQYRYLDLPDDVEIIELTMMDINCGVKSLMFLIALSCHHLRFIN